MPVQAEPDQPVYDMNAAPSDRLGKWDKAALEILSEGPATFSTLVARLGLSKDRKAVTRAVEKLENMRFIRSEGGIWVLNEGAPGGI